ncbi:hypothetical protein M8J76_010940 [Diaphorina citri]|nr:hypothetical protein M8J76_010940 [Diaphorina citri]
MFFFDRFPMTRSAQSLKEELEGTRKALRHQTIRCRQLVLAYSTKTKETELKLKQSEDLREKQLSHLLRVLYVLEAKLRKEQKSIREQLIQKDTVIIQQRKEIESLNNNSVCKRCLKKISKEREDEAYEIRTESSDDTSYNSGSHSDDLAAENSKPDLISSITYPVSKHKSVKEKVQSRDVFEKQIKKSVKFDINLTKISDLHEEEGTHYSDEKCKPNEEYTYSNGDDSVNFSSKQEDQIEQVNGATNSNSNIVETNDSAEPDTEFQDNPVLKCVNQILLRDKEDYEDEGDNDGANSIGITNGNIRNNLNESPGKVDMVKTKIGGKSPEKVKNQTASNVKPPPRVPPKPLNLNWVGRKIFPIDHSSKIKSKLAFMKSQFSLDNFSMNMGGSQSSDDELYVISNSALDEMDEVNEKSLETITTKRNVTGKNIIGSGKNLSFNSLQDINMEIIERKDKTDISPKVSLMVRKFEDLRSHDKSKLSLNEEEEEDFGNNELRNNFEEFSFDDCEVGNVENEAEQQVQNEDSSAPKNNSNLPHLPQENGVTYEKFLEATGLSQKSIVTPSRLLSTRKNMMRPKDVKHRSRAKAAAANYVDRCGTSEYVLGSTTKYWTEPFL